jgi:signal transduction histidine kinase
LLLCVTARGSSDKTGQVAQLAHDLNNALHAIASAIEIVRRRLPAADAQAASALSSAERNVDTAAQLAHQLLVLSGQDAGTQGKKR